MKVSLWYAASLLGNLQKLGVTKAHGSRARLRKLSPPGEVRDLTPSGLREKRRETAA